MVHIVTILNLTRYETQVNRQWINIILKELTKSNEDIRALFNITNQLATQVQVQNIMLHLRAMLANLRDCLHFMKQLANHVLEYIDTATTGTLTPHLIPVPDLQKMLLHDPSSHNCAIIILYTISIVPSSTSRV